MQHKPKDPKVAKGKNPSRAEFPEDLLEGGELDLLSAKFGRAPSGREMVAPILARIRCGNESAFNDLRFLLSTGNVSNKSLESVVDALMEIVRGRDEREASALSMVAYISERYPKMDMRKAVAELARVLARDLEGMSPYGSSPYKTNLIRIRKAHPEYNWRKVSELIRKEIAAQRFLYDEDINFFKGMGLAALPDLLSLFASLGTDSRWKIAGLVGEMAGENPKRKEEFLPFVQLFMDAMVGATPQGGPLLEPTDSLINATKNALVRIGEPAIPLLLKEYFQGAGMGNERLLDTLLSMARHEPEAMVLEVKKLVDGELGDQLLEVNTSNQKKADDLAEILLKCGKGMENAAA